MQFDKLMCLKKVINNVDKKLIQLIVILIRNTTVDLFTLVYMHIRIHTHIHIHIHLQVRLQHTFTG